MTTPILTAAITAMLASASDDAVLLMADPRQALRLSALLVAAEIAGKSDMGDVLRALIALDVARIKAGWEQSEYNLLMLEDAMNEFRNTVDEMLANDGRDFEAYWEGCDA